MTEAAIIAAEYTNGTQHSAPSLSITLIANGRREYLATMEVSGKREARAIAKARNATPWNF